MARKAKASVELTELEQAHARIAELEAELALTRANFVTPVNGEIVPAVADQPRSIDANAYGPAVLQQLERAAFADIGEVISFGSQGGVRIKPSDEWPPELRRLVTKVREDKDGNVIVEFISKDVALRLLGQASGVIKEQVINNNNQVNVNLMEVLRSIDGTTRGLPTKQLKNGNGHSNGHG